jgi:RNA polymerase sigma factor (TIGR02999 family)
MSEFTQLLVAARQGDRQAAADLFTVVYEELRQLAAHRLAGESAGHTLQPTALVHEVYLRLFGVRDEASGREEMPWEGRAQFFAAAAVAMRRILVDSARRKKRAKRGGDRTREPLDPDQVAAPELADELLDLDEALTGLVAVEPQVAELVTLRYFGGLTLKEAAATLGMAPRTADAHWAYARAWLLAHMQGRGNASP